MIENIKTKGMHGPDINQPCSAKIFFFGGNRTGKTSRTNAIHLCLNGFIATAHKICKKPADILAMYAKSDTLTCAIEIDGTEFEYHLSRDSKGKTSRRFRVDKKKYSEKEYMTELALSGNPKIIDLESFIQMSDAKKIDQLFKLYPAKVDIKKLNSDIEKKKAKISRSEADIKTKKAVIRENEKSKQLIELPAGTLADIRDELEDHVIAYCGTRDKITEIKVKLDDKSKSNIPEKPTPEPRLQPNSTYNQKAPIPSGTFPGPGEVAPVTFDAGLQESHNIHTDYQKQGIESLQKALKSMEDSGCSMCVSAMICKKEIRRLKNGS